MTNVCATGDANWLPRSSPQALRRGQGVACGVLAALDRLPRATSRRKVCPIKSELNTSKLSRAGVRPTEAFRSAAGAAQPRPTQWVGEPARHKLWVTVRD